MTLPGSERLVDEAGNGQTIAAILRLMLPGESWSKIKSRISGRFITIDGSVCMDPARRVKLGEKVAILAKPVKVQKGERPDDLIIRHLDDDIVIVEKVAGINTVRHPAELNWKEERRELAPTLQDITQKAIGQKFNRPVNLLPRLRIVHRLDKETSGLVVFARSVVAERELGRQFKDHSVIRRYQCIVPGHLHPRSIHSWLVRDRGDGRRGSGPEGEGKEATTHVQIGEHLPGHTLVICQLETGRTHQIRIHLAEAGHPVMGEKVYLETRAGEAIAPNTEAPRLMLHAFELGFVHPSTHEKLFWSMDLPGAMRQFVESLKKSKA